MVNSPIPSNATNTMFVPKVRLESVYAPMVWYSTMWLVWRLSVIERSTLTAAIGLNCSHQKAPPKNVRAKMESTPIQMKPFARLTTIALTMNPSKWNARLDYISTKKLPTVCGQPLQIVKDAFLSQVKFYKIHSHSRNSFYMRNFTERAAAVAVASPSSSDSEEFACPGKTTKDANGQVILHPKYAHPTDCQKFYLCLNGVEKRQLACDEGQVYNETTEQCDKPKNVEGWWVEKGSKLMNRFMDNIFFSLTASAGLMMKSQRIPENRDGWTGRLFAIICYKNICKIFFF